MMELFDDNASLQLIPLLAGLYSRVSTKRYILEYIDSQIKLLKQGSKLRGWLTSVDKQLRLMWEIDNLEILENLGIVDNSTVPVKELPEDESVIVDDSKSIMLGLLFGSIFTDALSILSNDNSISTKSIGKNSIYIVTETMIVSKNLNDESSAKLVEVNVNEILSKIDLTVYDSKVIPLNYNYRTTMHYLSKPVVETEDTSFVADLENWYCSCHGYQQCYLESWIDDSVNEFIESDKEFNTESDLVTSNSKNSMISDWWDELKFIKFDKLKIIPMCPHLLALLIVHFNPEFFTIKESKTFPLQL